MSEARLKIVAVIQPWLTGCDFVSASVIHGPSTWNVLAVYCIRGRRERIIFVVVSVTREGREWRDAGGSVMRGGGALIYMFM